MRLRLSVLSSLLLASLSAQADPGRINFSATQSNISSFDTDAMLPIWSNNNHMIYGDLAGGYGTDDTYVVSPGFGYRSIHNNQIVGAGLFADYERTSLGENFWVMSPGVEWMSSHWDAHVNGYFPTQSKQQSGSPDWADNFGDNSYVNLVDGTNNQYDAILTPYAVIGNGVDSEIGYSFDQGDHLRSRVFLGGYYYHPQESYDVSNITGATIGFTKSLSKKFTASLLNSYDNVNHYAIGVNVTMTLGGDSNEYSDNVQDRLLDPVERHIGIIGTGAGTYDQQSLQQTGYGLEYDNVWEVSPDGTGTGLIGDPAPLTQATLDSIGEDARIYVQGGDDANYNLSTNLVLSDGQDILGRTEDYTAPAASDEQPQINAASGNDIFDIYNGINTISDVTLDGNDVGVAGVSIQGKSIVTFSNLNILNNGVGVDFYNDTNESAIVNITNSTVDHNYLGIHAENIGNGKITMNISDTSASYNTTNDLALSNNTEGGHTATAILTVNNSQFLNTGTTSGNTGIVISNGSNGSVTATINNSILSGNRSSGLEIVNNTNGGDEEGTGDGSGVITVTVENSVFRNNGDNPGSEGPGVYIANNGPGITNVNIYNSFISNNGLYGLSVDNSQLADDAQSIIDVNLAGTSFDNNGGGYAIFGAANAGTSTTIDYTDTSFFGDTPTNQSSNDNITWISE